MRQTIGIVVFAALAGSAMASPTVKFSQGPGGADAGGAFWAETSGVGNSGTFLTFCIERNEYFNPGTTYYYEMSGGAIGGGIGRDGSGNDSPTYDELSTATRSLYYEYRTGAITSHVEFQGWTLDQLANAVQNAIWGFETEYDLSGGVQQSGDGLIVYNVYKDLGLVSGAGRVYAMNVYTGDNGTGENKQDMLIIIPLPSAAGLACAGLLGLAAVRRRGA